MREILFRGKRVDNGEWVEGNLFIPDKADTPTQICIGTNIVRITYDVILSTIGQYTGLTDKNGTKIFEGDIVKIGGDDLPYWMENGEFKSVEYVSDGFSPFNEYDNDCGTFLRAKDCEVVGNIHDNPKLLKEREGK